jgi:hypothetical protein
MTRPIHIPPASSPLTGLHKVLETIGRAAGREDYPAAGMTARDGTATADPPRNAIGLFKLTSGFLTGADASPTWTNRPADSWYVAQATRVQYYPSTASPANTWQTVTEHGGSAPQCDLAQIWAPGALLQNSTIAQSGDRVWAYYDEGPCCWVLLSKQLPYAFGAAYGAAQLFTGGGFVTLSEGSPQNMAIGNGTTGNFEITLPGAYLAIGSLSVGPGATGSGTLDVPPNAQFWGSIKQNGTTAWVQADGHFHCVTDPDNTAVPWKIPAGLLEESITLPPGAGAILAVDIDLPELPTAYGNIAMAAIINCAVNDQIGLYVDSDYNIEVFESSLVLVYLGPTGA